MKTIKTLNVGDKIAEHIDFENEKFTIPEAFNIVKDIKPVTDHLGFDRTRLRFGNDKNWKFELYVNSNDKFVLA